MPYKMLHANRNFSWLLSSMPSSSDETPWHEGQEAATDDSMCEDDNPYKSGSRDWNDWLSGYWGFLSAR